MAEALNLASNLSQRVRTDKQSPGLFMGFCFVGLIIVVFIFLGMWYLIAPRLNQWHSYGNLAAGGLILTFLFVLCSGFGLIFLTVISGWDLLYPHGKRSLTVKVLFPFATFLSSLTRISRDKLRASFVGMNNRMTRAQSKRISGKNLLVLLPHCLQIDKCHRNVTHNLDHCQKCGNCLVGSLKEMGEKFSLGVNVVNGGTLARKRVAEYNPTGIIAVACERDLTLGIQDVYPIPVMGIINERPHGPCYNTSVDVSKVIDAVSFFRSPRK